MATRRCRRAIVPLLAAVGLLAAGAPLVSQSAEEIARRQYQSGLAFLRDGKPAEALKDFQAVVDQYGNSTVADLALMQIALYHLETAKDPRAASAPVELILKKYPTGEAAAMAHVIQGRILIAVGQQAGLDAALAAFERARRLFPGTDAVPASMFHAAEALRTFHREDEALVLYRQVATDYARSIHAPRALLGEGYCLMREGRPVAATEQWQRVRQRYPDAPEARTAVAWNTIAYRLYLRPPVQPGFAFTGRTMPAAPAKLRDGVGLAVGRGDVLHVALRNGVAAFTAAGAPAPFAGGIAARGIAAASDGAIWLVQRGGLLPPGGSPVALGVPKPDGSLRALDDIPAMAVTSSGDVLVVDKDVRAIAQFTPTGKYTAVFAQVNATRLTINSTDDVAALERDVRAIAIFNRSGKLVRRLVEKGQGYVFSNLSDVAYDALGHLYVLDRGASAIYVFGPSGTLVTSFSIPERAPGSLRRGVALAVDSAGRLFVYDDDVERVLVYQ